VAAVRPAVFLDRDGTLNVPAAPGEYVSDPSDLRLLDGAAEAVALLRRAGYACIVVSNQRGVSLAKMSDAQLAAVDARLLELVEIDRSYYCTHGLDDGCDCRKPRPGLLLRAGAELKLDLSRSWMIGDSDTDCEAGRRAGCRTVKVKPTDGTLLAVATEIVAGAVPTVPITTSEVTA
jgi:D-glycero-D-manno-heptose 1,7-bisphosphate phosphatase